jgi:Inverse autotransporter, beta-domain
MKDNKPKGVWSPRGVSCLISRLHRHSRNKRYQRNICSFVRFRVKRRAIDTWQFTDVIRPKGMNGIQVVKAFLFTRPVRIGRIGGSETRIWQIAAFILVAVFATLQNGGTLQAQGVCPCAPQLTDPGHVFYGGADSPSPSQFSGGSSGVSPYTSYRCRRPTATPPGPGGDSNFGQPAPRGLSSGSGGSDPVLDPRSGTASSSSPYTQYPTSPLPDPADLPQAIVRPMPQPSSVNSGGLSSGPDYSGANFSGGSFGGVGGHVSQTMMDDVENADPRSQRGNCVLYTPYASAAYFGGTTPSTGFGDLFVPLLQNQTNMLFADVRGLYNVQSAYQGGVGGGLRSLFADSFILGGYGFYDYRQSQLHNSFQMVTVGVELLTWRWEARSNGYIPTSSSSGNTAGSGSAFFQNGNFYLPGVRQTALSGFDGETGFLLRASAH